VESAIIPGSGHWVAEEAPQVVGGVDSVPCALPGRAVRGVLIEECPAEDMGMSEWSWSPLKSAKLSRDT